MVNSNEKNIQRKKLDVLYGGLYFLFLILLISFIFLKFVSNKPTFNAIKELIAISSVIILPLLFYKLKIYWKLGLSFVLFIFFSYIGFTLANQGDLGLGALVYMPVLLGLSLIFVAFPHFALQYLKNKNTLIKTSIIVLEIFIIIFFIFASLQNINFQSQRYNNLNTLNKILCEGSYTATSPDELKVLCDQLIESVDDGNNWGERKQNCYNIVEAIRTNRYYFDDQNYAGGGLRSPANYKSCAKEEYVIFENYPDPYPDTSDLVLPEIKDPELCDHLDQSSGTYFDSGGGHVANNCYSRVAISNGDLSLCEKTKSPQQCYDYVALIRKDPQICDAKQDSNERYWCRAEITNNPSDCDGIVKASFKTRVQCYANIATRTRDLSVCENLENTQDIENCKLSANV